MSVRRKVCVTLSAFGVAACSAGLSTAPAAREDATRSNVVVTSPPLDTSAPSATAPTSTTVVDVTTPDTATTDTATTDTATPDTATTDAATRGTVTIAPPTSDATTDTASSPDVIGDDDPPDGEDPSFDLGPEVVLDVDVARFPVDDAGQGGAPAQPDATLDVSGPSDTPGWAGVDGYLESVLIGPGNTAASLAVSVDGELVHTAAFGVRDPSTGDPAGTEDRFRIASISKVITAITALQLVEDGVVGLDDPIGRIVADHVGLGALSASTNGLTLRNLLTHRSGFGKFQSTFFGAGAADCADATRQGLAGGARSGGYVYSNMNYCVIGMSIEALTATSYEQAAYTHLLTPLGISGMRLAPTVDPGPDEVQHRTTPGRNYMETLGAAGAWVATPSDLVTILDSLDPSAAGFHPLAGTTVLEMVVPPGGRFGQRGYGLGLISYGAGRIGHTGTIEATHAMLLDRGDGVTWAITVAGDVPGESSDLERIMNEAFVAGGFVAA